MLRTTPREVYIGLKSNFELTPFQKGVLVGTLLGDGSLQPRKKFTRSHIKHSLKQLSLVDFKRSVFTEITNMKVRQFQQEVKGKKYYFAEFVTLTHKVFSDFYDCFYPNGYKEVPKNIGQLLVDPVSLAVLIMDDGSAENAGLSISTHSFSEDGVTLLSQVIQNNFGISSNLRMNKGKHILYFPKTSINRLRKLIGNLMLENFKYKIIPYNERPRRDYTPGPAKRVMI